MDFTKIKNKCIYFISLLTMIFILVMIAYFFFLRTIEVDIMANAQYEYTGENGTATVSVTSKQGDLNQRVQEFLDTVTYQVSPNSDLKNGQVLHVSATYDKNLAAQYHYKPVSTQTTITVQGLPNRYDSLAQINKSLIKDAQKEAINYVKKNANSIYELDGNQKQGARLEKTKIVYMAYLKSNQLKNSDRFVYIIQLNYKEEILYYMVCIPNINDSNDIDTQNIYGEKAYLTQEELDAKDYDGYIQRVYSSKYTIEQEKK